MPIVYALVGAGAAAFLFGKGVNEAGSGAQKMAFAGLVAAGAYYAFNRWK